MHVYAYILMYIYAHIQIHIYTRFIPTHQCLKICQLYRYITVHINSPKYAEILTAGGKDSR